jgi:peptidyl-prolyl cis-trans isomerase B (cyclophilin B)
VQGKVLRNEDFATAERRSGRTIPADQRQVYKTLGGTPHLDQNYTVFGEVIKGAEVIDVIAGQPRDSYDRPQKDVAMQVKVEKMKKKKITKRYGYKFES